MNSLNDNKRTFTVLVRMYSDQNAANLKKQLPLSYQFAYQSSYDPEHIDICIIDSDSWKIGRDELLSIRKSQQPVEVPIMLMGKADTLGRLSRDILEEVDQILPTPISTNMLLVQLRNMRENRQKSVQLADQNKTLLRQERALRDQAEKSLEKFKDMLHNAPSAICMLEGPEHQFTYVNENYRRIFRKEEFIGRTVKAVFPEIVEQGFTDLLDQIYKSGESFHTGERSIKIWNTIKEEWYGLEMDFIYKPLVDNEGNAYGIYVEVVNVTDEVRYRTELVEQLSEKETLLAEIHHRVKNNLAVVSGMMQLQAYEEGNENVKQKLNDAISRIKTMGGVHDLLYQSESFTRIDADKNIRKLITDIVNTFQISTELELDFDLQKISLNINQAIPFSLVVNEVITNVMKHAFTDLNQGSLSVIMAEEDDVISIRIIDNGKGLPDNFENISNGNTLGIDLIDTLSTQLEGEYSYVSLDEGALFTFTFERTDVKGIGNAHFN